MRPNVERLLAWVIEDKEYQLKKSLDILEELEKEPFKRGERAKMLSNMSSYRDGMWSYACTMTELLQDLLDKTKGDSK
jgi:hypothetical protein